MNTIEIVRQIKRRSILVPAVAVLLALSIFAAVVLTVKYYAVEIDGKTIALVDSKADVERIFDNILQQNEEELGLNIKVLNKITYKPVFAMGRKVTPNSIIKEQLENNIEIKAEAFTINVDGKDIAFLKDKASAENILNRLKAEYLKDAGLSNLEKIGFLEDVKVLRKETDISSVQDEETAFNYIMDARESIKKYVVKSGDTISEIAESLGVKQSDIEKANPGMDIDRIQIGQELNLSVPRYVINIKEIETTSYEKAIPYDVDYEETSALYKGQMKVKIDGREGKKLVTAEILKVNGIVEGETVLDEKIIDEPQKKLILKGVKERPRTLAYGEFHNPSRGSITSRFGQRWGKLHTGIDIGISTGTSVKAADGGKVIFAGWKGNYGKLVIVDHENGYTTYYGHLSSIKVKVGQRVARDEVIALSGATGNVTGPHLHFEVRKNGSAINPLKFVNYK